jgi:hypothetical protein
MGGGFEKATGKRDISGILDLGYFLFLTMCLEWAKIQVLEKTHVGR